MMNSPIVVDLVFVAVVVFFLWRGSKKGFVLTLCSLLAVVVAFVGATILSNAAAPVVAGAIQPHLETAIETTLQEKAAELNVHDSLSADDTVDAVEGMGGIFEWAADNLGAALKEEVSHSIAERTAAVASAVAGYLARRLLFAIFFVLLLIAWGFVSRALDLVAKLPVINSLNQSLGGMIGAVKGLVLALVAVWILRDLTGVLSRETVESTYVVGPLLALLSRV